jgi:Carbohydrate binding domain
MEYSTPSDSWDVLVQFNIELWEPTMNILKTAPMLFILSLGNLVSGAVVANSSEYIKNGSFDDPGCEAGKKFNCRPWTFIGNAAVNDVFHSNKLGATVGGQGDGAGKIIQQLKLKKGIYKFSFWYLHQKGAEPTPAIVTIAGKTVFAQMLQAKDDWEQYTIDDVSIEKEGTYHIVFRALNSSGKYAGPLFQIDDVSLTR